MPSLIGLASRPCTPAHPGSAPLSDDEAEALVEALGREWSITSERRLGRHFSFDDFKRALAFANAVGAEAEAVGHHPDLLIAWGRCEVTLWTHDIGGIAEADFVLAARIERLYRG